MRKIQLCLIVASALASSRAGWSQPAPSPSPKTVETPKQFEFSQTVHAKVDYLLFLPQGYAENVQKKWPLILFLHGAGERGSEVWKVAVHGPPKYVAAHPDFPFIVISPQCPEHEIWSSERLLGLLEKSLVEYRVDPTRVYLTGLSMGGFGSWELGLAHPERFAAVVPICGGGSTITPLVASGRQEQALKTLGVWAFHGAKDPVVAMEESQRMVDLLKRKGVTDVKLTVYPEAGHDSWTETYNNPALYEWLLEHRRPAVP